MKSTDCNCSTIQKERVVELLRCTYLATENRREISSAIRVLWLAAIIVDVWFAATHVGSCFFLLLFSSYIFRIHISRAHCLANVYRCFPFVIPFLYHLPLMLFRSILMQFLWVEILSGLFCTFEECRDRLFFFHSEFAK